MSSWKADLQQQNNGVLRKDIIISKKKKGQNSNSHYHITIQLPCHWEVAVGCYKSKSRVGAT